MNIYNNIAICHSNLEGDVISCNKNFINLVGIEDTLIVSSTGQYDIENKKINLYNLSCEEYKFSDNNHKNMLLKMKAYGPYNKDIINLQNKKLKVICNSIVMNDDTIWHSFELIKEIESERRGSDYKLKILNYLTTLKNKDYDYDELLYKILEFGNKIFQMDYSVISHIREKDFIIEYALTPYGESLKKGDKFDLSDTCCVLCYNKSDTVVSFNNFSTSDYKDSPCNQIFKINSYIGTTIYYNGEPYGVISFSSKKIREQIFTDSDKEFILLLSQFVSDTYLNKLNKNKEEKYLESIESACSLLRKDKKKYNHLLKNVLPKYVLDELKDNYDCTSSNEDELNLINKYHNNCVILFLNLTNIGEWIKKDKPTSKRVIKYIHKYFSKLDELTKKYDLEKIRTIGNTYLLVGGLNSPRYQLRSIVKFAKDAILEIKELNLKYFLNFKCRIGINCGDLISGMVGKFRLGYDIYGESVNKAKKTEHLCPENKILVTEKFYRKTKNRYQYKKLKRHKIIDENEKYYILVD